MRTGITTGTTRKGLAITIGHARCLPPRINATNRHGVAHKVFFAHARVGKPKIYTSIMTCNRNIDQYKVTHRKFRYSPISNKFIEYMYYK
jgi:hypothetical protein